MTSRKKKPKSSVKIKTKRPVRKKLSIKKEDVENDKKRHVEAPHFDSANRSEKNNFEVETPQKSIPDSFQTERDDESN